MPIKVLYSNNLESLAKVFAEQIQRAEDDIFTPCQVIVPNTAMEKWLQLAIAKNNGISVNINFHLLERGLHSVLEPLVDKNKSIWLDRAILTFLILEVLTSKEILKFYPIRQFIYTQGKLDEPKLWQLASKLASLFKEYEHSRKAMIQAWKNNEQVDFLNKNQMAKIQKFIYTKIFIAKKALIKNWQNLYDKESFSLANLAKKLSRSKVDFKRELYFFCPTHLSSLHFDILSHLARRCDISIYAFNVCLEFWEDIETPSEKLWRKSIEKIQRAKIKADEEEGEELVFQFDKLESELLSSFGKVGREMVRKFSELEEQGLLEFEFLENFSSTKNTLLQVLQREILTRRTLSKPPQDKSLQIFSAPSKWREVETVYQNILHNLRTDKNLKISEVAVLVSDMTSYKPILQSVFEKEAQLSYNLVDSLSSNEEQFSCFVTSLFDLYQNNFRREDFFTLAYNEVFMQGFGVTSYEVDIWLKWVKQVNIFCGYKKFLINQQYTNFTWQQGLDRLAKSQLEEDEEIVQKLFKAVEILGHFFEEFSTQKYSLIAWGKKFTLFLQKFFQKEKLDKTYRVNLDRLFQTLSKLDMSKNLDKKFNLNFLRQYLEQSVQKSFASTRTFLTGGITLAKLQPMRPIPFKVVYILGLGEKHFPGKVQKSTLDLRDYKRFLADCSLVDENLYLFLENFMCVKEKLYLSYVNFDLQKEEEKYPSEVLLRLEKVLGKEFKKVQIPINYFSSKYHSKNPSYTDLFCLYSNKLRSLINDRNFPKKEGVSHQFSLEWEERDFEQTIELENLEKFLKNPAVAKLQRYNLSERFYETGQNNSLEPIMADYFWSFDLVCQVLKNLWAGEEKLANLNDFFAEQYALKNKGSQVPIGGFAENLIRVSRQKVLEYYRHFQVEKELFSKAKFKRDFGDMALMFEVGGKEVFLRVLVDNIFLNQEGKVQALVEPLMTTHKNFLLKHKLRVFLKLLCLYQSSMYKVLPSIQVYYLLADGLQREEYFTRITGRQAKQYLQELINDYYSNEFDLIDVEKLKSLDDLVDKSYSYEILKGFFENSYGGGKAYPPILDFIEPKVPQNIAEIKHERYGILEKG